MNRPAVSIILPAYNGEKYIDKAIKSVLDQTWADFELIIINDGSTDKTEKIIRSFNDSRIVLINNQQNEGLIFSLNKAIERANGQYVARMDADDICLPGRLASQKEWLDRHDKITAVATTVDLVNDDEVKQGVWELDRKTVTAAQIRKKMPFENCIAHPTIMIRTAVVKEFKYRPYQVNIEDYDLWLRLLSKGHSIDKIDEPLLLYRIHKESVTNMHLRTKDFFFRRFRMKRKFLGQEIFSGHINGFVFIVVFSAMLDFVKGIGTAVKNFFR